MGVDDIWCLFGEIGEKSLWRKAPTTNKHKMDSPGMRENNELLKLRILTERKNLFT